MFYEGHLLDFLPLHLYVLGGVVIQETKKVLEFGESNNIKN